MRVTIISAAYPLRGGIAQYTGILFNKLKQRGHEVDIITFRRQYPRIFFPGRTQLDNSNCEATHIDTAPILDSVGPLTWFKAYKRVKRSKADLVIFKYWMPFFAPCFGTICWLTKRFTKTKILYICDNVIPHERRFGDVALTRFAFRKADYFIIQSKVVKDQLLQLIPTERYELVPHPVYEIFGEAVDKNQAKKRIGIKSDRVILFFGYVRAYKGLDLILTAMPKILKQVKLKLLVVGEFYEDEAKFQQMIHDLNLNDHVEIHADFVPSEDVSLYFSSSDVLVLPYKSATQSGIVQIAYHLNKPCIVTDVGGLSEVVVDNRTGFVVPPESPDLLAKAVVRFYQDEKEREFSENVKLEKKKYSWGNMVSAIEGFCTNEQTN